MQRYWHAVYTKPNKEKKAIAALTKRGIESLYPLKSDSQQIPLFRSTIFVYINQQEIDEVKSISHIYNFLYYQSTLAVIKNDEIEMLQTVASRYKNVQVEKTSIDLDSQISVSDALFFDHAASPMIVKSETLKITFPSLGYIFTVEEKNTATVDIVSKPVKRRKLISASFRSLLAL